jgi:pimeloyl-ACP methyl ester carboxylesterase/quercetin dioxygenase-like cupin family protein
MEEALMISIARWTAAMTLALALPAAAGAAGSAPVEKTADVNGVTIHYTITGQGPVVVLLHGYAQTSHMWQPLLPLLAARHTVIAPDLRGAGGSGKPAGGYDKKTMAEDIHGLVQKLGYRDKVTVVGHDIGLMVAYAYAAQHPTEVEKLVLMDAFLPGVGHWQDVWLLRDLWHFHFHGETAEALVKGRERIYFEHFWNDFAADRTKSVSEANRRVYAAAYAQPGGMHAGFEYFKAFEQDAREFAELAQTKLPMPVLALTGEKASGPFLIEQARLVATNVQGTIVPGSGHWLIDEAPSVVLPALVAFIDGREGAALERERRLTPADASALPRSGAGPGTSGLAGISTTVLQGDPTRAGLYTIELRVPARTKIEAHEHPDERVATVVSGVWYFGYGDRHEEPRLKALGEGSFYTEPAGDRHFARTGDDAVVLHITGVGPTGTTYVAP